MLLCFLLATTFWILKALNKKYENVRISYPVTFIYNPQTQIPVTEPPREVVINVDAKGWKLLRKALNLRIHPAQIDLRNRLYTKSLTSRQLRPHVNAVLDGFDLNYVVTDTIYFNFEKLVHRKVPLSVELSDSVLAAGFLPDNVKISPSSIIVTGPASLINALPSPYPVHLPDSGIAKPYNKRVSLGFVSKNLLKPNVEAIHVAFDVVKLAKKEMLAPVKIRNRAAGKNVLSWDPKSVKLVYYFLPADSGINPTDFVLEADFARANLNDSTAMIEVIHKPAGVKTVSVLPAKVKLQF